MKHRMAGLVACVAAVVFMLPLSASASWKIVHQKTSGLVGYHRSSMRKVNDSKVHFVKVPKSYVHATGSIHTIKSTKGTKVSFTTKYLLPSPGRNKARWGNPQSIAISKGRLMYVVYCPTNLKNKGQIVRYNLNTLDKLGIRSSPKLLQSVYVKHNGKYSALQKKIQKAIKVGPMFTTGHGQSLAYNFKSGALYMWRDKEKSARVQPACTARSNTLIRQRCGQTGWYGLNFHPAGCTCLVAMTWPLTSPVTLISGPIPVRADTSIKGKSVQSMCRFT